MPHTTRVLTKLKEQGVRFIIIDPKAPTISKIADIHLKVRPGTDGALALGMIKVIIEKDLYDKEYVGKYTSGFDQLKEMVKEYDLERVEKITMVPRDEIEKAAQTFAARKPASIITGIGVEHQTNTVQTIRAINILLSITGNVDREGGNTFISPPAFAPDEVKEIPKPSTRPIGAEEHPMFVGMIKQAHALVVIEKILKEKESPIKALIVAGGAPIPQLANTNKVKEAIEKLEFVTVIDLFMTETAKQADLVFPAAFFLERDEIGPIPLNLQNKVVDGGQCWPDWKIWCELAKRMGYERHFPWQDFEELADFVLNPSGLTCRELRKHPEGITNMVPPGTFLNNGFHTKSRKIELYSHLLETSRYDPLPVYKEPMESILSTPELAQEYPLTLITGNRQPMYLHSQHRNIPGLRKLLSEPYLEIHPQAAQDHGIKEGDLVRVESRRGSLKIKARLTEGIMPQVLHIPHGWVEADCNLLTDHENRDPISGFPGLKSSLCRISKD
jgi:anaerobic selenocysteine-containing dehydrogenase